MPSDESKGSQLDAIGSLAQRQLDNTVQGTQGGVRYKTTLEEFGIDTSELEWKTMPAPSAYRPRSWSKWVVPSIYSSARTELD